MDLLRGRFGTFLIAIATALVILVASVGAFLNPWWVAFAQDRAGAPDLTGWQGEDLRAVTDAILADLVIGPPDFDVALAGEPVLNDREREHMRDVRGVFGGFAVLGLVAAIVLAATFRASGADRGWKGVRAGGVAVAVITLSGGAAALLLFDRAFELFHRLFFAEGSWTFDPASERLVQLFPMTFWVETSVAVGVVMVALGLIVAWVAGRRRSAVATRRGPHMRAPHATPAREP